MFNTPYNKKVKDEMMAIDKSYIKHSKKVSTKGLLNVSVSGNKIGGGLPGVSPALGRPIGGARTGGARTGGADEEQYDQFLEPLPYAEMVQQQFQYVDELIKAGRYETLRSVLANLEPQVARYARRQLKKVESTSGPTGRGKTGGARTGGKAKRSSPWIEHVKAFAKEKGVNYRDALRMPECKSSYKKVGGADPNRNLTYEGVKPKEVVYTEVQHKPNYKKMAKQLGAELVAEANADIAQASKPTSATTAPRVISEDIMGTAGKLKGLGRTGGYRTKGAVDKKPRKPSAWVAFVKDFASRNKVSYSCALSMPQCKAEYRAPKEAPAPAPKKRLIRKQKNIE